MAGIGWLLEGGSWAGGSWSGRLTAGGKLAGWLSAGKTSAGRFAAGRLVVSETLTGWSSATGFLPVAISKIAFLFDAELCKLTCRNADVKKYSYMGVSIYLGTNV